MALPTLTALEQCADYAKAVESFLPQLYDLPQKLVGGLSSREDILELYVSTNPLVSGFALSVALGLVFLVVSEINKNYSQVDRCWSILPTVYIAHFDIWARLAGVPSQRIDAILFFSTLWSIRLTFNYWRRGGYNIGSEDYRWEIIRQGIHPALFHVFNATFISFVQSILLFFLAAPAYIILLASRFEPTVTSPDIAFVAMELGLILVEVFADQQQWDYHAAKQKYQKTAKVPPTYKQEDLDRGFCATGLWAFSRHPNFAAEQMIWFVLYQWSCYASKTLFSWAGVGPFCLILLFQGSTWITELISSRKYPEYREYQKVVGVFIPVSFSPYRTPAPAKPKVIRTSELAKKQQERQKEKQK